MTTDPPVLGLVAGDGVYPEYIVRGARRRTPELRIVAVGFKGETNPAVIPLCDAYQEFSVGQISKPFTFLKKHGVRNVIMAGGINPKNILSLRPDLRALSVLMRMPEKNADSLLGAVITEAEKEGFTILPASTYMEEHMPQPGHIAGPPPTPEQWEDARFGMQTAKEISRLHIGQSVIVHGGTVIAVEAIEGTNNCIRRGGELGNGKPATLAKVAAWGMTCALTSRQSAPSPLKRARNAASGKSPWKRAKPSCWNATGWRNYAKGIKSACMPSRPWNRTPLPRKTGPHKNPLVRKSEQGEVVPRTGGRMGNGLLQPPPGLRILILVHDGFGLVAHAFSHVLDGFLASFAGVFHLVLAFLHVAGSGIVRTSAAFIHMILGFTHNKQIFLLFIV